MKDIWPAESTATAVPKCLLLGTDLTWSNSGQIGWLRSARQFQAHLCLNRFVSRR